MLQLFKLSSLPKGLKLLSIYNTVNIKLNYNILLKWFSFWVPRDGPDQNSPQLGVFSGNTALETAFSSSNQVLLKFHSDFSTGGFFVLNFHGQYSFSHLTNHICVRKIRRVRQHGVI